MNQPELGNYIAQLRKEQGLTQEELVEKCNINVRTIQRIEAGEVTPRSFTVKNILEALGKSIDDVFKKVEKKEEIASVNYNRSLLGWGIIAGIFYLILGTFNVSVMLIDSYYAFPVPSVGVFGMSLALEFIVVTVFMIAIVNYGKSNNNSLIKNTAYGAIAFFLVFYLLDFMFYSKVIDKYDDGLGLVLSLSSLVIYGLMYLFLAIGFFIHREKLGELAKWTGIIGIIGGFSFCLIILFPVGVIGVFAFNIMLIILLYRAWDSTSKKPQ